MKILLDVAAPSEARIRAAKTLGRMRNPLGIQPLLDVLDTRDLRLRETALESLRELGAVELLQLHLTDPKQPAAARQAAARGLRFLKNSSSIGSLVAALKDSSADVRAESALALSSLNPAAAQEALITALRDPSQDVRYYAAEALGAVPTPQVRSALAACKAMEKDESVQYALDIAFEKVSSAARELSPSWTRALV